MKAFFAIAIAIVRLPKLHGYWRQKEWLFRMPSFAEVMPRDRFMQIYRYLHMSDDTQFVPRGHSNHDLLFKVRALLDLMQTRFRTLYNLNEDREVNLSGRVVRELMVHTRDVGHHLPVHRQLLHQSADDAGAVSTEGN